MHSATSSSDAAVVKHDEASAAAAKGIASLPECYFSLDDVVGKEIADLAYPWDISAIEDRIAQNSVISEAINSQLSARVMQNYGEFVQGMQQVQSVETELTLIGVLVKNSRRKLQERDSGLVQGGIHIARQQQKSERLSSLLVTLEDFQSVSSTNSQLRRCANSEDYCQAIAKHEELQEGLSREEVKQFPSLVGLKQGLTLHLAAVRQKLSDGLRIAAVSSDFDAEQYEEILRAYSMMNQDHAAQSLGKELLRHVSECIVSVSRQCMLAFSSAPSNESPSEWHRKAQLRDLCRSMDPTHFVACTAQLYEHLCDFLYRHQFLCSWHACRLDGATSSNAAANSATSRGVASGALDAELQARRETALRTVVHEVLTELLASKRNVWERVQQQVSLVLMTLDFQYPALSEDSFLHILSLTQLLVEEGDVFMADFQASSAEGRRQWSSPIRNTLKSKAHDYFQSLHFNVWMDFKTAHIEQDSWQRLPVPRSYRLIRPDRARAQLPRPAAERNDALSAQAQLQRLGEPLVASLPKLRTGESNPFRNYKPEPLAPAAPKDDLTGDDEDAELLKAAGDAACLGGGDDLDEHALLQHWIDDRECLPLESIGSSMLSNSNRSPVVSSSTVEAARILERYFRMMGALPQLANDIFQSASQLLEFYVHAVLGLFVRDGDFRVLLEDLDVAPPPTTSDQRDPRLYARHDAFLLQQLCPDLRRAMVRIRDVVSGIAIPDGCAMVGLSARPHGGQGPLTGSVLLQVTPFAKLTSPSSLCGLAERCVGVESVCSLLLELRDAMKWLSALLPRGAGGNADEAIERFLPQQEAVASQLRTFVLMCAARDILETPDVGRVSLEHFSSTVQALRWDVKDFSQGSPAAPYLEQLRAQVEELARRIPCAGGGSVPHATQRTLWGWVKVRIMQECAEVIARCGRRKTHDAIFCLAEDFRSLRSALQLHFGENGASEEGESLLPAGHPLQGIAAWTYLDNFLEAHGIMPNEVIVWCKAHPEYSLRLMKAVIEYVHSTPKAQKQYVAEIELYFSTYISDESVALSTR